jgi:dynactin complex subunit
LETNSILEKVKNIADSLKEARDKSHEIPYAQKREDLIEKFESLKRRADQIKNPKTRAKAYRLLAKLEQLLTDPPAYSLAINGGQA